MLHHRDDQPILQRHRNAQVHMLVIVDGLFRHGRIHDRPLAQRQHRRPRKKWHEGQLAAVARLPVFARLGAQVHNARHVHFEHAVDVRADAPGSHHVLGDLAPHDAQRHYFVGNFRTEGHRTSRRGCLHGNSRRVWHGRPRLCWGSNVWHSRPRLCRRRRHPAFCRRRCARAMLLDVAQIVVLADAPAQATARHHSQIDVVVARNAPHQRAGADASSILIAVNCGKLDYLIRLARHCLPLFGTRLRLHLRASAQRGGDFGFLFAFALLRHAAARARRFALAPIARSRCGLCRWRGSAGARSANHSYNGIYLHGGSRLNLDFAQGPAGRRGNLGINFVGGDFEQGFVARDFVAHILEPFCKRALKDGFAHLRHHYISCCALPLWHSRPRLCSRDRRPIRSRRAAFALRGFLGHVPAGAERGFGLRRSLRLRLRRSRPWLCWGRWFGLLVWHSRPRLCCRSRRRRFRWSWSRDSRALGVNHAHHGIHLHGSAFSDLYFFQHAAGRRGNLGVHFVG